MKKALSLLLALSMVLALTACGSSAQEETTDPAEKETQEAAEPVELYVFAAASLEESLNQAIAAYEAANEGVTIVPTYDSSGTLKTQIQEGADCDVFISAAPKQMNQLDAQGGEENTEGLDFVDSATRLDLLENKVTLAVPEGNPKGIETFDQLAELLQSGDVMLAMGNSDVPVGQYTQKIFAYYGIDEAAIAGCITSGSGKRRGSGLRHHLRHRRILRRPDRGGRSHRRHVRPSDLSCRRHEEQRQSRGRQGVPGLPLHG